MVDVSDWTIRGSEAQPLIGNTHAPERARACVVLMHGYLGYKDYGFFPVLAERLAAWGAVVHRFNFAHSGMTNRTETFARPELFERQTWNAQVYDTLCVLEAMRAGRLAGHGLPTALVGHSRGGVTALLTAGRHAEAHIHAVITLASPDTCCSMSDADRVKWLETGWLTVRSNRTGQELRVGSRWLEDQLADPAGHDVLGLLAGVRHPICAIHGQADPTVDPGAAACIERAALNGRSVIVPEATHVFNISNPPVSGEEFTRPFELMAGAVEVMLGEMADNPLES